MKLFVGLGNPGSEHARNRHNVGFMAVEHIAAEHSFSPWRRRFQGLASEGQIGTERVLILKPGTYMNESGRAVGEAARFLKVPETDIVVFYDEIDLLPGRLKVKTGGGNAGHKGLRSISAHLGNDYVRVRIGVGHPGSKDLVSHWVLRDFSKADGEWLEPLLAAIAKSAVRLVENDQARFLSDVQRLALAADQPEPPGKAERAPERAQRGADGERRAKRTSALAENLKKWLAGRKSPR
jgi:PTH1 family peptidyl-tRNA hydrolase